MSKQLQNMWHTKRMYRMPNWPLLARKQMHRWVDCDSYPHLKIEAKHVSEESARHLKTPVKLPNVYSSEKLSNLMFFGCQKLSKSCKSIFTPHTVKTSVQEGGGNRPFHPLPTQECPKFRMLKCPNLNKIIYRTWPVICPSSPDKFLTSLPKNIIIVMRTDKRNFNFVFPWHKNCIH